MKKIRYIVYLEFKNGEKKLLTLDSWSEVMKLLQGSNLVRIRIET